MRDCVSVQTDGKDWAFGMYAENAEMVSEAAGTHRSGHVRTVSVTTMLFTAHSPGRPVRSSK